MNKGLISGLVLLTFGLVCGLLLATVNELTKDRIAFEELRLKTEAIDEYYSVDDYHIVIEEFSSGIIDTIFFIYESESSSEVYAIAYSGSAQGYGGLVTILVVIESNLNVLDYQVISHQESGPGLRAVGANFNYRTADSLAGFDSQAGATLTSNAFKQVFTEIASRVKTDMGVE